MIIQWLTKKLLWFRTECYIFPFLGHNDCANLNSITRSGMPFTQAFALEPLLKKFGVDIIWTGHEHSYERMWPIFNGTVLNRGNSAYSEPQGPIHIVTGSPVSS